MTEKLSLENRLGLVIFEIDREKHIKVNLEECKKCKEKPCLYFCPARRYTLNELNEIVHDYEGCLECGTCKFACPKGAVEFKYPRGGFGVQYRYG
ncbi:MAG TPA: ferredoxin family protein [Methanosarcinales archaeon]|nr:ferredoxin family protein [Methanosarcinales archaeon]